MKETAKETGSALAPALEATEMAATVTVTEATALVTERTVTALAETAEV